MTGLTRRARAASQVEAGDQERERRALPFSFKPPRRGTYVVARDAGGDAELACGRGRTGKRLFVVVPRARPGGRAAPAVRALQRRLSALGYVTSGQRLASTPAPSRAVLAFRKVYGMGRSSFAGPGRVQEARKGRRPLPGPLPEGGQARRVRLVTAGAGARARRAAGEGPARLVGHVVHANRVRPAIRFYSKIPGYNSRACTTRTTSSAATRSTATTPVPTFPASHGCIRIPIPSAVSVYRWIRLGTKIFVYR